MERTVMFGGKPITFVKGQKPYFKFKSENGVRSWLLLSELKNFIKDEGLVSTSYRGIELSKEDNNLITIGCLTDELSKIKRFEKKFNGQ